MTGDLRFRGKFKVLHDFNGVLARFFHFGRIFTPLKRRKNRAFRSNSSPPLRGSAGFPLQSLAQLNAQRALSFPRFARSKPVCPCKSGLTA
jgi:hypothetical protein